MFTCFVVRGVRGPCSLSKRILDHGFERSTSTQGGNVMDFLGETRVESQKGENVRFHSKGVPLGSILNLVCPMDVFVVNGNMEELRVTMQGAQGSMMGGINESEGNDSRLRQGTRVYDVHCTLSDASTAGRIVAEIPPRYFGLRIKTAGNVVSKAGLKEAQVVAIESHGNIQCQGALSSESMRLVSHGGSVQASNIMANSCSIDTRIHTGMSGSVSLGRSSCLELVVDAGTSPFEADSLLCSNATVNAGTITAKNVNTLDGKVHFGMSPSRDPNKITVKGMDGQLSIALPAPTRGKEPIDDNVPINVDIQLNENAKSLIFHGNNPIMTTLHAPESLNVQIESGDELKQHCATDVDNTKTRSCKIVLPPHSTVKVNRRSWFDAFRQSSGFVRK
jgi:hypothetical protein